MESPVLYLCAGKDCFRKERGAYVQLKGSAQCAGLTVQTVKCQGSCAGPTAVVAVDGGHRWFERLQSKSVQQDLVSFATAPTSSPTSRLKKRELSGKQRQKAKKKLAKSLESRS